ncbi:MAG TPA: branched-chain amino acid ABC transporter permease [Gaiellaceae bacterium]|nr:branched-chain amino acid ABC transporter permease [Gaiellaceae bacterium]
MSLSLQIVLSGLAAGSVYGLIAVGYVLVYRLTGIVHFALGDLVGLGVFVALLVTAGHGTVTQASASSWRFAAGLAVAIVAVPLLTAGSWFAIIEPQVASRSTLRWVAATAAIAFAIQSLLLAVFARPAYVFPDPLPFHRAGNDGVVSVAGATFQLRSLFVIVLGLALAAAVGALAGRTRFGRGLEAIAEDAEGAAVVGVPRDRFVGLAFGLVGAVAVVIAVAAAPSGPFSATTGSLLGVKGLVAALVVLFGSPLRAYAAGLALGLVEAVIASGRISGHGLGPSYREVIPFLAVLALLAVRGRVGAAEPE